MINIERILCPTDLSPHSGKSVRYALALARAHEAELILLHCTNGTDAEEELGLLETSLLQQVSPAELKGVRWRVVVAPAVEIDDEIMRRVCSVCLDQKDDAFATFSEIGKRYPSISDALKERVKQEQALAAC